MNIKTEFQESNTQFQADFGEVAEVGGGSSPNVSAEIAAHNADQTAHADLLKGFATTESVQELSRVLNELGVEVGDVETALVSIIAIQNELIGGDT